MSIKPKHKQQGVAALWLWEALSTELPDVNFSLTKGRSQSSFLLTGLLPKTFGKGKKCNVGLFLKSASQRASPWRYNFQLEHQKEIFEYKTQCGEVFTILIAGDDGIACLNYDQLKQILDEEFEEQESVTISRKPRQNYRVSGNDGRLESPLPKNVFPNAIVDHFRTQLYRSE